MSQLNTRSAFIRGGLWALAIGLPVLAVPLVLGWLKPGPLDPRVLSNLLLMPVFAVPIFVFGGFIGMFRGLSRQAQQDPVAADDSTPEHTPVSEWAYQRTHDGAVEAQDTLPALTARDQGARKANS